MAGSGANDEAEISGGGSSPPPSSSSDPAAAQLVSTAVVIAVSSSDCSAANDGEPESCAGDPLGGSEVIVAEQLEERKGKSSVPGPERAAGAVVDVSCSCSRGDPAEPDAEEVCRICHLSPDLRGSGGSELIRLGCGCKGQLGIAHRGCAEAWFRLKGNRCCEICGANAENVIGKNDGSFMEEWHGRRMLLPDDRSNGNSSERGGWWRGQPFCNFLMAFLVIAFVLSWFFRMNIF